MPIKRYEKKKKTQKKVENKKRENKKRKFKITNKTKKIIKRSILAVCFIILIAIGVFCGKVYGVIRDAKLGIDSFIIKNENSVVKDINDVTIAKLSGDENREIISISEMSPYLPKAFVSIEDERFYEHRGVDVKRTFAATAKYALSKIGIGSASYGGSTITQQLVKNATNEKSRTWERKVKEMARAYYIEDELSKDQILEQYLNLIYLGGNTYGVQVASNYYFSKNASELTLAESAFLAGINNSPERYKAFSDEQEDKDRIKNRTLTVLAKMYELRNIKELEITEEEYNQAKQEVNEGLKFNKGIIRQNIYSYHTDAAIRQIAQELMEKNDWNYQFALTYIANSGLTIYTTQDSGIQKQMEEVFTNSKHQMKSRKTKDENGEYVSSQAAMVLIDHKTGYVLATVGGLGEKTTSMGLQRATQSPRPTGSSMKPLAVLAPGIDSGVITAGTVFDDVPTSFGGYSPKNSHRVYKGLLTVRYAIESSQNIPMVKGLQKVGIDKSIEFLKSVGISTINDDKDKGLAIALGGLTNGVSPLEMAGAYAAIANDGVYIEPTFYTKVVDSNNNVILESRQVSRTVMSSAAAYVVKEVLTQPVKSGTATVCRISNMSVAAKTGTTDADKDRWLCGFTPYYTAAAWYGYDEPEEIISSTNPAAKMWAEVMKPIHSTLDSKYFSSSRPNGVVTARICRCSGMIATDTCKEDPRGDRTYVEYFVRGTVPKDTCTCHVSVDICQDSGCLANEYCTNKVTKVFITRPDADKNTSWKSAGDRDYMLTITDTCTMHKAPEPKPEEPVKPEEPATPTEPTIPEEPTTPDKPTTPGEPTTPEEPVTPTEPTTPTNEVVEGNTTNETPANKIVRP